MKAEILQWQTRSAEVLNLLQTAPPPELSSGEFAVRAIAAVGMAHANLRQDGEGASRLQEADEMATKSAPQLRCLVLLYEGNQGLKLQNYPRAEQRFRESFQLARQYQQTFLEAGALIGLGIVLTRVGRYDEAIEWSLSSFALAQSHQYHLVENIATANVAWSYQELGDLDKALYYFSQQESVLDALSNDQLKLAVLSNVGEVHFDHGNYVEARASYLKALDLARKIERNKGTNQRSLIAVILSNLAVAALEENKVDEAAEYSRQATTIDSHDPRVLLAAGRVAAARGKFKEARDLLQKIALNQATENLIRWDVEAELANISAAERQNSHAERQFQSLIYEVEAARSALRVDENRLAFSFHAGRYYDDYVRFLIDTRQERKAFQVAEFSRARTLEEGVGMKAPARPSDISISTVQNFLRLHKKTILAYWLARKNSYLWLVSPSQFKTFTLVEESKIEPEVDSYNKILINSGTVEDLEQVGQSLYRKLIAPAQGYLRHDAGVVIIPDGRLNRLNFETLRVPQPSPHYWIEDVEAQIADSTALLIRSKRDVWSRTPRLLVMGDPMEGGKPALPHGVEEIRRVEAHFPEDHEREVSGAGATPSAYKANHPERYDLIHIVAHGSASELSPLESALILSSEGENSSKLYAREIVKTHLNADLVTISACGGAGKRAYSGEGLVGLAWAFLKAGAHRVVAGLWEVDDRAAVDLTDDFYTELQKRTPTSAALRAAKLKMVHSTRIYRLPYYWGSLQLYMGS